MKPDRVQIIAVSVAGDNTIYGLGDDSQIYIWNKVEADWKLHIEEPLTAV
jgi:hypothetical protein